jgi:hypothetical protein
LIPTEIFPSNLRAQGNGFGITGWAIGVGWTVLVNPIMFDKLQNRTYFLFAALNLLWIPIVYLFYPETKVSPQILLSGTRPVLKYCEQDRSLESMVILFMPKSPFNWAAEQSWREHANGDILALDDDGHEPIKNLSEKAELAHS